MVKTKKKTKALKNNFNLNYKGVIKLVKNEAKKYSSLDMSQLKKEEEKINLLDEIEDEYKIINSISSLMNNLFVKATPVELEEIAQLIKPKIKKKNQCLQELTNIKEMEFDSYSCNKHYTASKDNKKVYVKEYSLEWGDKTSLKALIDTFEMNKLADRLKLSPKIIDYYFCKDFDGKYKLFIIKEFMKTMNLDKYRENNKLTQENINDLKNMIDTAFDNNIIFTWINSNNILVIEKKNKIEFMFKSLDSATPLHTYKENCKKNALDDLDWLFKIDQNYLYKLSLKKLLRKKAITINI